MAHSSISGYDDYDDVGLIFRHPDQSTVGKPKNNSGAVGQWGSGAIRSRKEAVGEVAIRRSPVVLRWPVCIVET